MQPWQDPRLDEIRDEIKTWSEAGYPGGAKRDRDVQHDRNAPPTTIYGTSETMRNSIAGLCGLPVG